MSVVRTEVLPPIQRGDVLVLHGADRLTADQFQRFTQAIGDFVKANDLSPVTVLPLREGMDLSVLDEAEMRKAGWVRVQAE